MSYSDYLIAYIVAIILSFVAGFIVAQKLYSVLLHDAQDAAATAIAKCHELLELIKKSSQQ